jgi:hypothetical protein
MAGADGEFDGPPVQDGQGAGQAEAHRANVRIRRSAKARAAPAEDLAVGEELRVNLQPDYRLVGRQ